MSNVDPGQEAAAATTPRLPSMAICLAIGVVMLATLKLEAFVGSIPKLILSARQAASFGTSMPTEISEPLQPWIQVQNFSFRLQAFLIPVSVIGALFMLWGAFNALRRRMQGDRSLREAAIAGMVLTFIATAFEVSLMYYAFRIPAAMMNNVNDVQSVGLTGLGVGQAIRNLFFFALAWSLSILLLQFGYYVYTYRYFSKPEIRALY